MKTTRNFEASVKIKNSEKYKSYRISINIEDEVADSFTAARTAVMLYQHNFDNKLYEPLELVEVIVNDFHEDELTVHEIKAPVE